MLTYVLLLIGFVLLIKGADYFVEGSSNIARLLRIPSVIIGLTVVAFGTSMPEASVSITAAIEAQNELALSNVIGSNIFNLLVVVGVCAAIKPMGITRSVLKREFPFSILITVVLLLLSLDREVGKTDGWILLAFFVLFLIFTVKSALKSRNEIQLDPTEDIKQLSPLISGICIIGGLAAIVIGGDLVVNSAVSIAESFGLSQTLIGLTIVALGTSLPELVTSIVASRKGENDIALGNVVGSNIFNILLVLGASSALHPVAVNLFSIYDIIILIIASIVVFAFALQRKILSRMEGWIMLLGYAVFMGFIILR
ncbi:calcium/sodium antiporter [uncultured Robinsoniella sp.]|uniref:calcium/sodium antiporter n=1 Tax=uncultured Robinsoniella sp. TaxID=904190 RepID=UPI00374EDEB8